MAKESRLTDPFVQMVEQEGSEIGVTLIVAGRVVSGILTPRKRYFDWLRDSMDRTLKAGGTATAIEEVGPMSEQQQDEVRAAFLELHGDDPDLSFRELALRDVSLDYGRASLPFLLVETDFVAAMTLGALRRDSD